MELTRLSSARIKELKAKCGITEELIAANITFPDLHRIILLSFDKYDAISISSIPNHNSNAAAIEVTVLGSLTGTHETPPSINVNCLLALFSSAERAQHDNS